MPARPQGETLEAEKRSPRLHGQQAHKHLFSAELPAAHTPPPPGERRSRSPREPHRGTRGTAGFQASGSGTDCPH